MSLPTDDTERKRMQMWTFLTEYFPDAFEEVVKVAVAGNEQHNPGEKLHWARGKSMNQMDTAFRHQWDYARGVHKDTDGMYHLAKAIWRLQAELQLLIEQERSPTPQTPSPQLTGNPAYWLAWWPAAVPVACSTTKGDPSAQTSNHSGHADSAGSKLGPSHLGRLRYS
jgi:hypothetical protein